MIQKSGFSLLEIIVSVLLLGLVMVGLVNVFVSSKRYILHTRSRMAVGELARYALDNIPIQARQDEWGSNCLSNISNCTSNNVVLDNTNYTIAYNTTDANTNGTVRRVIVNITWNEPTP